MSKMSQNVTRTPTYNGGDDNVSNENNDDYIKVDIGQLLFVLLLVNIVRWLCPRVQV